MALASPAQGKASGAAAPDRFQQEPLPGQEAVARGLEDEEFRELLEILHLRGEVALPPLEVMGPGVPGALPRSEGAGEPGALIVELRSGGRWGGDALLDPGTGLLLGLGVRARAHGRFRFFGEIEAGGRGTYQGLRELLVSVRVAGIELSGGRATPRLGPGRDDLLAPGTHPLDGVGLSSVSPFRLPGPLGFLGAISVATSVHPMDRVGPVEDPWYGILAISTDPIPAWRIGVLRSAVFGGEGVPPVTAGRVARMIAGWHSTNQGEFEDQYAEFFTRLRLGLGEFPLVVYGALAVNDSEAAYRDDPGLLAGVLVPLSVPGWLGALRYEYLAVGAGASLCPRTWCNHYLFGMHETAGLPMGATLGGYGTRHALRWRAWSDGGRWSAEAEIYRERREELNLLLERWPGTRTGVLLGAAFRPDDALGFEVQAGAAKPGDGSPGDRSSEGTLELLGRWTALSVGGGR